MFDLLVSENQENTLLKLCELICSFIRIALCFDFTNLITENKNSHQHVVLDTEVSGTQAFYTLDTYFLKPFARHQLRSDFD